MRVKFKLGAQAYASNGKMYPSECDMPEDEVKRLSAYGMIDVIPSLPFTETQAEVVDRPENTTVSSRGRPRSDKEK